MIHIGNPAIQLQNYSRQLGDLIAVDPRIANHDVHEWCTIHAYIFMHPHMSPVAAYCGSIPPPFLI